MYLSDVSSTPLPRRAGHVAGISAKKNTYRVCEESLNKGGYLIDLGVESSLSENFTRK